MASTTPQIPVPSTTVQDRPKSAFLSLPLEVRTLIWNYLFIAPGKDEPRTPVSQLKNQNGPHLLAPWHLVNKQLHQEQAQILQTQDKKLDFNYVIQRHHLAPTKHSIIYHIQRRLTYPSTGLISLIIHAPEANLCDRIREWIHLVIQLVRTRVKQPKSLFVKIRIHSVWSQYHGFHLCDNGRASVQAFDFEIDTETLKVSILDVITFRAWGDWPDKVDPDKAKCIEAKAKSLTKYFRKMRSIYIEYRGSDRKTRRWHLLPRSRLETPFLNRDQDWRHHS